MRNRIAVAGVAAILSVVAVLFFTTAKVSAGWACLDCPSTLIVNASGWSDGDAADAVEIAAKLVGWPRATSRVPRLTLLASHSARGVDPTGAATNAQMAAEFGKLTSLSWKDRAAIFMSGELTQQGSTVVLKTAAAAARACGQECITAQELHAWLAAIPARVWLVLDLHDASGATGTDAAQSFASAMPANVIAFVATGPSGEPVSGQRFIAALRTTLSAAVESHSQPSYRSVFKETQLATGGALSILAGSAADEQFFSAAQSPTVFKNVSAPAPRCDAAPSNRALLIGVGHLQTPGAITDLRGPESDLPLLRAALELRGVTDVQELLNPTRNQLLASLDDLIGRAQCGDDIFVHFSGVTTPLRFPSEKPYVGAGETPQLAFATADAVLQAGDAKEGFVTGAEVVTAVTAIRNRGAFVLLSIDGCQAELLDVAQRSHEGVWRLTPFSASGSDLAPLDPGAGGFGAFYAAASRAVTPEFLPPGQGNRAYGLFSFALARAFSDPAASSIRSIVDEIVAYYKLPEVAHGEFYRPVFEASDPDHAVFRHTSQVDGLHIELTDPQTTRGVMQIETLTTRVAGRVVPATDVVGVLVNGTFLAVGNDGRFSTTIPLAEGVNQIQITSLTKDHRIAFHQFSIEHGAALANQLKPKRRVALIIANKDYGPQSHLNNLQTPIVDGEALANVLRTRFGFSTAITVPSQGEVSLVLKNATRRQILSALSALRKTLSEDDDLLIFYAGHGLHNQETDQAYWIPVDANYDEIGDYISASDVTDMMKMMHVKHLLLISDSCYAGALNRDGGGERGAPSTSDAKAHDRYIAEMARRRARILISSGADEPVADGGGGGHSVFAGALLKGLDSEDGEAFTAEDLFARYINEAVVGNSKQSPQRLVIRASGHDGGDFVFWKVSPENHTAQSGGTK